MLAGVAHRLAAFERHFESIGRSTLLRHSAQDHVDFLQNKRRILDAFAFLVFGPRRLHFRVLGGSAPGINFLAF